MIELITEGGSKLTINFNGFVIALCAFAAGYLWSEIKALTGRKP